MPKKRNTQVDKKERQVARDAVNGRFIPMKVAIKNPAKTVVHKYKR